MLVVLPVYHLRSLGRGGRGRGRTQVKERSTHARPGMHGGGRGGEAGGGRREAEGGRREAGGGMREGGGGRGCCQGHKSRASPPSAQRLKCGKP